MNNIFEDAKFGDKFLTRDGRIAVLISQNKNGYILAVYSYCLYVPQKISSECHPYNEKGQNYRFDDNVERYDDIVSRYQEPIDEEKLDKVAYNSVPKVLDTEESFGAWYEGFKTGYRKAKKE